jgi:hypothetical protein
MANEILDRAIILSKNGKKLEAREILKVIVTADPQNETTWLWVADKYTTDANQISILESCLKYNSNNQAAQKWLATFKAEETKRATKQQEALLDFQNKQSRQIKRIDRKPIQITKKNRGVIILSRVLGLAAICLLSE